MSEQEGTEHTTTCRVRLEAHPLSMNELETSPYQTIHLERLLALLLDFVRKGDERKASRPSKWANKFKELASVDAARPCNAFLLDGVRGVGKTTLALTVLEWLNQPQEVFLREGAKEKLRQARQHLAALCPDATTRLIPLQPLDLCPLASDADIMMWIASALYASVARRDTGCTDEPWPQQDRQLELRWHKFCQMMGIGFVGSAMKRINRVEPEVFVVELERTERERVTFASAWRSLADEIVLEATRRLHPESDTFPLGETQPKKNEPTLLLLIDDADLSPQHTAALLQVLRSLWHPRIAFLVTGDSELFEAMTVARDASKLTISQKWEHARDLVRKTFPPQQRTWFGPVTAVERVSMGGGQESESHSVLRRCQIGTAVTWGKDVPTLYDLYCGLAPELSAALPENIRELQDEYALLEQAVAYRREIAFAEWSLRLLELACRRHEQELRSLRDNSDNNLFSLLIHQWVEPMAEWVGASIVALAKEEKSSEELTRGVPGWPPLAFLQGYELHCASTKTTLQVEGASNLTLHRLHYLQTRNDARNRSLPRRVDAALIHALLASELRGFSALEHYTAVRPAYTLLSIQGEEPKLSPPELSIHQLLVLKRNWNGALDALGDQSFDKDDLRRTLGNHLEKAGDHQLVDLCNWVLKQIGPL